MYLMAHQELPYLVPSRQIADSNTFFGWNFLFHRNDIDVHTLHNVRVVEEHIQIIVVYDELINPFSYMLLMNLLFEQ